MNGADHLKGLARKIVKRFRQQDAPVKSNFIPKLVRFSDSLGEFDFWINSEVCGSWYPPDAWVRGPEYQQLGRLIKPGDRVLEVGCNIGFTTMLLSRFVGETGYVLAVDVVPDNVILAQATAFLNSARNVCILQTAVGEAQGEIGFSNQLNGLLNRDASSKAPLTSCDVLDKKFGPFNALKVDVEGYEGFVLKGATRLLSRFPKLALEIHSTAITGYGMTVDDLLCLFHAEKYEGMMYARHNPQLEDFRADKIGTDSIANLFLSPKLA